MTPSKVINIAPDFIDIFEEIDAEFRAAQNSFQTNLARVPSIERYHELEINRLFESRFGEAPFRQASYDGISLRGYYNMGWDAAELGQADQMPATVYWWDKDVLAMVVNKIGDNQIPPDYYKRLDVVAKEEYKEGIVNALFYYWLKDWVKDIQDNPAHSLEKGSIALHRPLLQWNPPINTLITLFHDFLDNSLITWNGKMTDGAKMETVRMLCTYFVDKNGKPLSVETIRQGLKPEGARAKHRIDLSNFTLSFKKNTRR